MPQHLRFAVELNHRIELRLVLPLAVTMAASGAGLIWTANINIFQTPFLLVGVGLYIVALTAAVTVLLPSTTLHLAEHAPPPAAASGPPPQEVMTLIRRLQIFGGLTTVLFLVIIFLMVIQPGPTALR